MATTTDPHDPPKTGLHGEGTLDAKTDVGGGSGYATEERHGLDTGDFDREIKVSRIVWTGVWLVVLVLVSHLLMWWLMRGFEVFDNRHDAQLTPMQQLPQAKPSPGTPLLQVSPTKDMVAWRAHEDTMLNHASWVDRQGGSLRVPVDVAIDAIAQRGVAPFPATGAVAPAAGQTPQQTRAQQEIQNPADNRKPGATVQSGQAGVVARPAAPATPPPSGKPPVR